VSETTPKTPEEKLRAFFDSSIPKILREIDNGRKFTFAIEGCFSARHCEHLNFSVGNRESVDCFSVKAWGQQ
jgi:hypothetical protein